MDKQMEHFKERLAYWTQKIKEYQDNCPHTNHTKVANANIGNLRRQDDSYWFELHCPDCDKQWTEDQKAYLNRMYNRD